MFCYLNSRFTRFALDAAFAPFPWRSGRPCKQNEENVRFDSANYDGDHLAVSEIQEPLKTVIIQPKRDKRESLD